MSREVAEPEILERMTDAFVGLDGDLRVTRLNGRAQELLDVDDGLVGSRLGEAFPDGIGDRLEAALREAEGTGEAERFEARHDGLGAWFAVRVYPDEAGFSVYLRDVTERKERAEELRLKERAMDAAPMGITISDPDRTDNPIVYANESFGRLTGYPPAEAVGRNCRFLQGPETDPETVAEIRAAIAAGRPVSAELRNYRRNGEAFWNRLEIAPITDGEGAVENYVGFQLDVTETKQLETQLRESERSLREVYEVTADPDRAFEEKIPRLLGIGCERLGVSIGFLTRIDREEGVQRIVQATGEHELIQPGASCPLEEAYCRKTIAGDGLLAMHDVLDAGWQDDPAYGKFELGSYIGGKVIVDGELYGTLCFADDEARGEAFAETERTFVELLTQWVSYELDQRRTRRELRRQNERLDDFASVVSHDLRNPLNVAAGHLDLAREGADSEHLAAVADALDRMEELIENMLTVARQGQAVDDDERERLSVAELARDAWSMVETDAATLEIDDGVGEVRGDEARLEQALENLFRNAVEHAGADTTVRVGPLEDGFYVEDDGPGIPADERESVFEHGYSTDPEGTGFGLTIVRELIESHGWSIRAVEGADGGARFEITVE